MTDPAKRHCDKGGDKGFSGPADGSSYPKARTALAVYQAQERQLATQKKGRGLIAPKQRRWCSAWRFSSAMSG